MLCLLKCISALPQYCVYNVPKLYSYNYLLACVFVVVCLFVSGFLSVNFAQLFFLSLLLSLSFPLQSLSLLMISHLYLGRYARDSGLRITYPVRVVLLSAVFDTPVRAAV